MSNWTQAQLDEVARRAQLLDLGDFRREQIATAAAPTSRSRIPANQHRVQPISVNTARPHPAARPGPARPSLVTANGSKAAPSGPGLSKTGPSMAGLPKDIPTNAARKTGDLSKAGRTKGGRSKAVTSTPPTKADASRGIAFMAAPSKPGPSSTAASKAVSANSASFKAVPSKPDLSETAVSKTASSKPGLSNTTRPRPNIIPGTRGQAELHAPNLNTSKPAPSKTSPLENKSTKNKSSGRADVDQSKINDSGQTGGKFSQFRRRKNKKKKEEEKSTVTERRPAFRPVLTSQKTDGRVASVGAEWAKRFQESEAKLKAERSEVTPAATSSANAAEIGIEKGTISRVDPLLQNASSPPAEVRVSTDNLSDKVRLDQLQDLLQKLSVHTKQDTDSDHQSKAAADDTISTKDALWRVHRAKESLTSSESSKQPARRSEESQSSAGIQIEDLSKASTEETKSTVLLSSARSASLGLQSSKWAPEEGQNIPQAKAFEAEGPTQLRDTTNIVNETPRKDDHKRDVLQTPTNAPSKETSIPKVTSVQTISTPGSAAQGPKMGLGASKWAR